MIFASDLDNTLIYSYKNCRADDICVEYKDSKALSFMTPKSTELLRYVADRCTFVPVTTRSVEQYNRVNLPAKYKYAIVCNGAILLVNGNEDSGWTADTQRELGGCTGLIREYYECLLCNNNVYDVRLVNDYFIFAKFYDKSIAEETFGKVADKELFDIAVSYNKIYITPKSLNKGTALERLKTILGNDETVICAGDSKFDIPMLNLADTAIVPSDFEQKDRGYIVSDTAVFSEFVLNYVKRLSDLS